MKTKLLLMVGLVLLLCGCRAHYPVAQETGKEDMAYLLFVSPNVYANQYVTVTLDDQTKFEAKVVKAKKSNRRGTSYAISTGRKKINVESGGKIIYQKEIFVSTQETKIITLP
ncbi:hypothetical protein [Bacteroides reticulotermitis]|nr:hypothetical protein [Bacteroides reticulotermitis]MBB4045337.1 hypothetical protein [Bacteroides reticulotermitis]